MNLTVLGYDEDKTYAFAEEAIYQCQPEYFFDHDETLENFSLTCEPNGLWTDPTPWKGCESKQSKTTLLLMYSTNRQKKLTHHSAGLKPSASFSVLGAVGLSPGQSSNPLIL